MRVAIRKRSIAKTPKLLQDSSHSPATPFLRPRQRPPPPPLLLPPSIRARDFNPILPLLANLHQDTRHDTRTRHEAMPLALEDAHLAAAHRLAQPLDVVDGDARVAAAVVDDDGLGDVDVAEADGVPPLEAHEEVDGRVGARRGELPDGLREAEVVDLLAFFIRHGVDGGGEDAVVVARSEGGTHAVHVLRSVWCLEFCIAKVTRALCPISIMSHVLLFKGWCDVSTCGSTVSVSAMRISSLSPLVALW